MAASSSNKNEETDRSKKVNSMDTRKIDNLAAKVDLLLKNNQNQIYVMVPQSSDGGSHFINKIFAGLLKKNGVGVENGYDEVNVQIPEEEKEKPSSTNTFSK